MSRLSNPVVQIGKKITFRTSSNTNPHYGDKESFDRLNSEIYEYVRGKILVGSAPTFDELELFLPPQDNSRNSIEVSSLESESTTFHFNNLFVRHNNTTVKLRFSCSLSTAKSDMEIWSYASSETSNLNSHDFSITLNQLKMVSEKILDAFVGLYLVRLRNHITSKNKADRVKITKISSLLLETGDYSSARLFDSINTIRETHSLFNVASEGYWRPIHDLLDLSQFRNALFSPAFKFSKPSSISEENIAHISKFFNQGGKGLLWDINQGACGLFVIANNSIQSDGKARELYALGICSDQFGCPMRMQKYAPVHIVSPTMAQKLSASF